jgi:hypothetical protein
VSNEDKNDDLKSLRFENGDSIPDVGNYFAINGSFECVFNDNELILMIITNKR